MTPTGGQADGRILVEISTRETAEILPMANALRLIEEGLSFPTTRAPRAYCESMDRSSVGVHEYGLGIEAFMLWSLKGENGTPVVAPQFRRDAATIDCTVDNRTTRLNEAHVMILPSGIDGGDWDYFSVQFRPVRLQQCLCTAPSAIMLAEMSVMSRTW